MAEEQTRNGLVGWQLTKVALVGVVGGQALHGAQALLGGLMSLLLQSLLQPHQHKQFSYKDGLMVIHTLAAVDLCRGADRHINCKHNLGISHTHGCRVEHVSYNDEDCKD